MISGKTLLLTALLNLISILCKQCPKIETYQNPYISDGFLIRNFLNIPDTNILIINTLYKTKEDSNIIYYTDMTVPQGEVINVIKPDFIVMHMDYIPRLNKILIINAEKVIIADPYTLKTVKQLFIHYTLNGYMIKDTDYAVILTYSNQIKIFDTITAQIIQTMDHNIYDTYSSWTQYYSKIYKFSIHESHVLIISSKYGLITWDFNVNTRATNFYGFIEGTYNVTDSLYSTRVTKHPTADIIFAGGLYLQITAYKLIKNENGISFKKISQTNLFNGVYINYISSIEYVYKTVNSVKTPYLLCGDSYYIFEIPLNEDLSQDKIQFVNTANPYFKSMPQKNGIYRLQGSSRIILDAETYVINYDYQKLQQSSYLGFYNNDEFTKKFMSYSDNKQFVVAFGQTNMGFFDREKLNVYAYQANNKFLKPLLKKYNSLYTIKNCNQCLLVKLRDQEDYVSTTNFLQNQIQAKSSSIKQSLQLNWDLVGTYLDPFKLKDKIWFVVGFPNKSKIQNPIDGLFYLINAEDTTIYRTLKTSDQEINKRNTNFALVSLEDVNNLEIIGIDAKGIIYIWDLSSENYDFKQSFQFDGCLNSQIGDIFHYQQTKKLVLACDDYSIRAIDTISKKNQNIRSLNSTTVVLRAFSNISIIAIGEKLLCETYIYKYNPVKDDFEMFLAITTGTLKSVLVWIELLKDNTIWIQYRNTYIFYKLGDCLDNSADCKQCTQSYYFDINNKQDTNGIYGLGTISDPYISSLSFITSMVKAQFYKDLIIGVSNMFVDINISPNHMMTISKGITDFDFTPIISLTFKSSDINNIAKIQYYNQLILKNYNSITIQNVQIFYHVETDQDTCGLLLQDIKNYVIIDNIQQYNEDSNSRGCQQISIQNSFVQIKKYKISSESFKDQEYLISTIYSDKIIIENLTIDYCEFGESFQILKQETSLQAELNNLYLTNNYCIKNLSENTFPVSLFSAGLFSVSSINISGNVFCNKNIFTTITSQKQKNQIFKFKDIEVTNNTFYLQTTYIFFNSLYSMLSMPSHELVMENIKFKNNQLQKRFQNELSTSSYIQTNRIAKLQFDTIYLENHFDIQFSLIEFASEIMFNKFYCINDDDYLASIPNDKATYGCIQISESNQVTINELQVDKKKAQDNSLLIIQNIVTKQSTLNINDSQFKNLILSQSQTSTYANPIHVESSFQIILEMNNCHFENNKLSNVEYSLTHSTTSLWVENHTGSVLILNSQFINCQSDSSYNFMYIQSSILQLENSFLQKSSFTKLEKNKEIEQDKYLFKQEGGMINAKVSTLKLIGSEFNQSTALIGSFLYIQSFSEILKIIIKDTQFSEGYSSVDGGAFFIDTRGSQIQFECEQCKFNNIYTLQAKGSAISFQQIYFFSFYKEQSMVISDGGQFKISSMMKTYQLQYIQLKTTNLNQISFIGGSIKNIKGIFDNYFIECTFSQTKFEGIPELMSYEFISDSDIHKYFSSKNNIQQSTLVNLINSTATIYNCYFFDLNINNPKSTYPLLINAERSTILFKQSSVKDSNFISNAIKLIGGKIIFEDSQFINVNQYQQKRILQQLIEVTPKIQANSLIFVENGELQALQQSKFQNIVCSNNCNGSIFSIKNGNLNLENIVLQSSKSTQGGCLFINGIEDNVIIKNVNFYNCKSEYHGGAIYISSLENNKFKLSITNSQFTNNTSIKSKGGAIYIISDVLNPNDQIVNITQTYFISNIAQIGGALYQQNISANIYDSKFLNNKGDLFGNDEISYPSKLYLINKKQFLDGNQIEIEDFRSGDQLQSLSFQFRNEKNETIIPVTEEEVKNYNVQVRISLSTEEKEKFNIRGDLKAYYDLKSQSFQFNNLFIVGNPGTSVIIEFVSDQIYVLNSKSNTYEQTYSFKINVKFRQCVSGEQILAYNNLKECEICPEKKFSYGVSQCLDCPTGATCLGGVNVVANAGYWRKTNESSQFIYCSNLEENCKGGFFGNEICFEGHIGALCEECDIYGEQWDYSYSKSAKYKCSRCDQISYNFWIVVLVTIWTMITISIAIKGDIDNAQQKITEIVFSKKFNKKYPSSMLSMTQIRVREDSLNTIRSKARTLASSSSIIGQIKQVNGKSKKQEKSGVYIKIFTNYMYIVSSIATFNIQIPSGIFEFSSTLGSPIKQTTNSLDCALKDIDTDIPILYLRLIFSIVIVLSYFCLFLIGICLYSIVKKQKTFPWYILSSAAMFIIIYVQPDLINQTISLLSCRPIGETNYILSNVSYECYTDQHLSYIGFLILPLFLIWVFVFPIILFLKLKNNKDKLDTIQIKLKYGFLYKEYKNSAFYWEFVKIVEKLAIILFLNFYSQSIVTKGVLVFITITIYGILSLIIQPYQESEINQLDVYSTNVCGITILLGVFMYNNQYSYFIYSSLAIIIILNVWLSIKLLRKIIEKQFIRIKQLIQSGLDFLQKKIPILQKCIKKEIQNKQINIKIKQKIRNLLLKYVEMKPFEKIQFLMKMIELQLNTNCRKMLKDDSDSQKKYVEIKLKSSTEKKQDQQIIKTEDKQEDEIEQEQNEHYTNQMTVSKKTLLYRLKAHRISDVNTGDFVHNIDFDSDNYFFDNQNCQPQVICPCQNQDDSLTIANSKIDPINTNQSQENQYTSGDSQKYLEKENTKFEENAKTEENDLEMQSSVLYKLKNYQQKIIQYKQNQ